MKKIFILFLVSIICTGCVQINSIDNYDIIIDTIISSKKTVNTSSMGYKYYLPIGVSKVYDKDYNQKLKIDNIDIYMYVDTVSYYYRNSLNFNDEDESSYYYRRINNAEKIGYIKITEKEDNKYFMKAVYNYAKIECYVPETKIEDILSITMIILDSIDYNDNLIEKILQDEYFSSVDKEYKINKPDDTESKFSEYLSEYVQEEESIIPDLPEY